MFGGLDMEIVSLRLRALRESVGLSQNKLAGMIGVRQSSINRYENGQSVPSVQTFRWYADYFDVSMDYIYGRTDNPQGKIYNYEPQLIRDKTENSEALRQFVDMCFDPKSPMNDKLKQTLIRMLEEGKK
jgi:repressor LexA